MRWTARAIADRAKKQILEDVRAGVVPATVPTFSALHDYVDANEYGDITSEECPFDAGSEEDVAVINSAFDSVDAWIRNGGVRKGGQQ